MKSLLENITALGLTIIFFWWCFCYPFFPLFEDEPKHMVEWSLTICAGFTTYVLTLINANSSRHNSLRSSLTILASASVLIISIFATGYAMRMQVYRELPCTKMETSMCDVCTESDYDQGGHETCLSWEQEECVLCTEKTYYVN